MNSTAIIPTLSLEITAIFSRLWRLRLKAVINPEQANEWKTLSGLGAKLVLMVPKASKARVIDLLWKQGLADKVSVGSYDINISMP